MFPGLVASFLLLALCVVIHATGIVLLLRSPRSVPPAAGASPWRAALFVVRIAWWLLTLHLVQIVIWAIHYRIQDCLPDLETAIYFSGVSYTTLGYGDVLLPQRWRMLGPAEGLTGILMCGFSTGFFFAIVHRLLEARVNR